MTSRPISAKPRTWPGRTSPGRRAELARLIKAEAGAEKAARGPGWTPRPERSSRASGYVGGYQPPAKDKFGPADDLKTLLPFNRKFEEAEDLYSAGQTGQSIDLLRELIRERPDFDNPYLFLVTVYENAAPDGRSGGRPEERVGGQSPQITSWPSNTASSSPRGAGTTRPSTSSTRPRR